MLPALSVIVSWLIDVEHYAGLRDALVFGVLGLILLWTARYIYPEYASIQFFALLYIVSFPVRLVVIESDLQTFLYDGGGVREVGSFAFTAEDYLRVVLATCAGVIGILCGAIIGSRSARHLWPRRYANSRSPASRTRPMFPRAKHLSLYINIWFIVIVALTLFNGYMHIGTLAVTRTVLPFKLAGVLHLARAFAIPLLGVHLFGISLESKCYQLSRRMLVLSLIAACVTAPATLSKAASLSLILPLLLVLLLSPKYDFARNRLLRLTWVCVLLAIPVSILTTNVLRDLARRSNNTNSLAGIEVSSADLLAVTGDQPLYSYLISHSFTRILGLNGLMAVSSASPLENLVTAITPLGLERDTAAVVFRNVYNYYMPTNEDLVQGKGFGLFAFLFLSHSLPLLVIGGAFFSCFTLLLEAASRQYTSFAMGVAVAFHGTVMVWEFNADLFLKFTFLLIIASMIASRLTSHFTKV